MLFFESFCLITIKHSSTSDFFPLTTIWPGQLSLEISTVEQLDSLINCSMSLISEPRIAAILPSPGLTALCIA